MNKDKPRSHRKRHATVGIKADGTPYEVGYCLPPLNSRFPPGRSGNRTGKKKRAPTGGEVVDKMLREKIAITEGGKTKMVTKLDALARSLFARAVKGDPRAINALIALKRDQSLTGQPLADEIDDVIDDIAVIDEKLSRFRRDVDLSQKTTT